MNLSLNEHAFANYEHSAVQNLGEIPRIVCAPAQINQVILSLLLNAQQAIAATASEHAPWYVVPADNKWFTRLVVAAAIVEAVEQLDLAYPRVSPEQKKELAAARAELAREA